MVLKTEPVLGKHVNGNNKLVLNEKKSMKTSGQNSNYDAVRRSRERSRRRGQELKEAYAKNQERIEELNKLLVKLSDELEGRASPQDLVDSSIIEGASSNSLKQSDNKNFDTIRDTKF